MNIKRAAIIKKVTPLAFPPFHTVILERDYCKKPRSVIPLKHIHEEYLDDTDSDPYDIKELKDILRNPDKNEEYFEDDADCTDSDTSSQSTLIIDTDEDYEDEDADSQGNLKGFVVYE